MQTILRIEKEIKKCQQQKNKSEEEDEKKGYYYSNFVYKNNTKKKNYDNNEPSNIDLPRTKSSQIIISWLVAATERGFVLDVHPTPGNVIIILL